MDSSFGDAIKIGLDMALKESPERPMEFFVAAMERHIGFQYPPERRAQMLALDARALIASLIGTGQEVIPKAEEVLPRVTIPCLIYVGETDPWYQKAKECAGLIPNATFFYLLGLGHVETFGLSDLVLPHIKKFLAEHSKK
jgi:pimeloyl-ACP methyl ester carboxylesterase